MSLKEDKENYKPENDSIKLVDRNPHTITFRLRTGACKLNEWVSMTLPLADVSSKANTRAHPAEQSTFGQRKEIWPHRERKSGPKEQLFKTNYTVRAREDLK